MMPYSVFFFRAFIMKYSTNNARAKVGQYGLCFEDNNEDFARVVCEQCQSIDKYAGPSE